MKFANGLLALIAVLLLSACNDSGESNDDDPATAWGGTSSTATNQGSATGSWGNAPDFSFTTFDGRPGKLSEYGGRPVVVNFWAAW